MKVSIIIPTFNEEKAIRQCLYSLENQSYQDFEVIVVDDGSTDTTFALLSDFKPRKYKLLVLKQIHEGPALARNLGAKKAVGSILVFVDSDMTFDKNFIKELIEPIIKGEAKGTFSKEEYVANWNNLWARAWNLNANLPDKRRLPVNYPNSQKVFRAILKREFEKVGGFSKGGYTDDWSLSEKLGFEAKAVKGALFYHQNPESLQEVFQQAKWIGKRNYKLGLVGVLVSLLRSSLPFSIIFGSLKALTNLNPSFLFFKLTYDFGIFVGILEMIFLGKTAK